MTTGALHFRIICRHCGMAAGAIRRGFRVVEVPITFADRRVGRSKMSRAIVLEALWKVWAIRAFRKRSGQEDGSKPSRAA